MVPKKEISEKVSDYRPIIFWNISYKIISKLFANRLRVILSKVISPLESAFVPNGDIHDNGLVAHDKSSRDSISPYIFVICVEYRGHDIYFVST